MTEDEIRKVDSGGLIEIGAHTVNHPVLYSLPPAEQTREILKSKQHLESILDKPVQVFSYPHGSWSETTEEIVREAGYSCACASASDVVRRHDNRYRLPRFWVRNEGGELFDRWLKRWLAV
jgi:peptidoglycan/xylan/chitin deacetylase (PgdA/CDA1 family)